jgi:DNA adenine methylase
LSTTESPTLINSILPYFGGKRTMADRIVAECCRPDGSAPKTFWELCCASMAVSLAMPRCSHHHVVDLHGDVINLARVIQDRKQGPELYRRLRRVLNHEGLFAEAKAAIESDQPETGGGLFGAGGSDRPSLSPVDRAFTYFIVSWQGRNGAAGTKRVNYQPSIRWTGGGGHSAIRYTNAVRSIPAWRRRLADVSILQRDIFDVLPKIADEAGTSIYIDPPYLRDGTSRTGSCEYLHEFNPADHEKLASTLCRFKSARVVVSYYDHPLLRDYYPGWTLVDCTTQKNLHVQNRRGVGRCEAPEVLLINGPSLTVGVNRG